MANKKKGPISPFWIWALSVFYKLYFFTLRKKVVFGPAYKEHLDAKKPVLLAFWHKDVNSLLYISWKFKTMTMISDSRDGQIVAQLVEHFGSLAVRGSSRNGPVKALKGFIRTMRQGTHWASIAVDGPKGPPEKAKPGVLESARLFKCPIFSIHAAYSSAWIFKKTWDQTRMPKPFSRLVIYVDLALPAQDHIDPQKFPVLLSRLDKNMSRNERKTLGLLK